MRIISGTKKGKKILLPNPEVTRPLKDSVKENIFNVLKHSRNFQTNFQGIKVLDFFSGSGSFGLECISRGAKKITFVEKNRAALGVLNKNLSKLNIESQAKIVSDEIINFLLRKQITKYHIIFFDPPFAENKFIEELKLIREKKIYKNNHLIIIHREKKSSDNFLNIIDPLVIKQYSRSKIIFAKFLSIVSKTCFSPL